MVIQVNSVNISVVFAIFIFTYISEGVPSSVIADIKLVARERVVGVNVICLDAKRYSAVDVPVMWACLDLIFTSMEQIDGILMPI